MKQFARNVDQLGRVVLPVEIRRINHIKEGDLLFVNATEAGILLTPAKVACAICGSGEDVLTVDGIKLCRNCAERIRRALK